MATRVATSAQRVGGARDACRGVDLDPRALGPGLRRTMRPGHLSTREWLWRVIWLPWWLGSDMPAPALPRALPTIPAAGPAGDHVARHLSRLVRRLWIQRALLLLMRSIWLGVAVGCGWVLLELLGGPALRVAPLVAVTGVLIALGMTLAACSRPTYMQVARMLDCSFSLQDRMRTAVEHFGRGVPAEGERAPVVYLQMADAANVMTAVHKYPAFRPGIPVREVVLGITMGLVLGALYLIRGATGELPDVASAAVPGFVPAKERLAAAKEPVTRTEASLADSPTAEDVQAKAEQSNAAREDLETLADALADHPTTRDAAEAIREGDYARAARELSEAAANADQLSPAEREGLAADLDAAAGAMSGANPELQAATTDAADGLREGGEPAKEGVENLGTEVGQTGEEVVSQEQLAGEMRDAQAADQQRASQGGEQSGEASQPSDAGEPQSGQGQPGEGQPGESEGQAGEPGEGSDAAPGEGQQGQESQQGDPSGESGEDAGASDRPRSGDQPGGQPSDSSQGQPGDSQQPGAGEGQPGTGSEAPAAEGDGGDQPSEQGGGEGDNAQTGSGAGSGEGAEEPAGTESGGQTTQQTDADGDGVPDPNVTEPTGSGTGQSGEGEDPRDGITLSRSPDAEGYQTSGDAGSSSLGSGSGATAGTGETSQGEVGEAGPDANRVPREYRDVVEDYFTNGD